MIKPYRKINTSDQSLMQVQQNVAETLAPLSRLSLLNGNLIKDVTIGTANTQVEHKLGRMPLGWLVIDQQGNTNVWRPTAYNEQFLTLIAGTSVTISLWVF